MNHNCCDYRRSYVENCRVTMCKIVTRNTTDEDYPQLNSVVLRIKAKVWFAVHIICNNRPLEHENSRVHEKCDKMHVCVVVTDKTHRYSDHDQPGINRIMTVHEKQTIRICVFVDTVIEHAEIIHE